MTTTSPIDKLRAREINALIDKLMQWNAFHDMPGETCRLSTEEVGTAIVALEKHVATLSQPVMADLVKRLRATRPLEITNAGDVEVYVRENYAIRHEAADALSASPGVEGVVGEIAAERERQKTAEGWTPEHDDNHDTGDLARAAACYAMPVHWRDFKVMNDTILTLIWPMAWGMEWWKPKDRRRDLVRAAALIVAEVERLDRAAISTPTQTEQSHDH